MALTKRLNWLKWLYPGETELQTEQSYLQTKRRRHMTEEHSGGITRGLEVLETSPTPDLNVHVQVGRVVDPDGDDVNVESIVDLDLSSYASGGGTAYIVAEFDESLKTPYTVPELGTTQYTYYEENPVVKHQASAPSGGQVELARVVVTNGATQITDAADYWNPGNNEIDMTHRVLQRDSGGWVVLSPLDGTLTSQLNGSMVSGKRYWLEPGAWSLGAILNCDVANVIIAGSRQTVIDAASHRIDVTADGVELRGFEIQSTAASTNPLINVNLGDKAKVRNIKFSSDGNRRNEALSISSGVDRTLVEGCEFDDCVSGGSPSRHIDAQGTNITIRDCKFTMTALATPIEHISSGSGVTTVKHVLIENNRFEMAAGASGQEKYAIRPASGWQIVNNDFYSDGDGSAYSMFLLNTVNNVKDVLVTGNKMIGSQRAMVLDLDSSRITENYIKSSSMAGDILVRLEGSSIVFSSNHVYAEGSASSDTAVYLSSANEVVVSDNTILMVYGGYGIRCVLSGDVRIDANDIYVQAVSGFAVKAITSNSPAGSVVSNNHVVVVGDTQSYGIELAPGTPTDLYAVVEGNSIEASSSGTLIGIRINGSHVSITGNNVRNGFSSGESIDLVSTSSTHNAIVGNVMNGDPANATGSGNLYSGLNVITP